ncbi:Heterokaryon incompatibility protein (HET) domain containing protein [Hyaloscypha variabilis]
MPAGLSLRRLFTKPKNDAGEVPVLYFRVLRKTWPPRWPPDLPCSPSPGVGIYSLITRSIDDSAPFSALSYRWSNKQGAGRYLIIDGSPAIVCESVWQFLEQMKRNDNSDDVFIDCLCINQKDDTVKASQVSLMGEIYSKAETVYLWFASGPCPEKYTAPAALVNHEEPIRRTWTVQEFLLAKSVVFMCGSECLNKAEDEEDEEDDNNDEGQHDRDEEGHIIRRRYSKRSLAKVLMDHKGTACGWEQRDKVYGFLGLCTDKECQTFPVNYSPEFGISALFCEVMKFCLVNDDLRVGFAHSIRDNLGLNEKVVWSPPQPPSTHRPKFLSSRFGKASSKEADLGSDEIIYARAWKVAVISHSNLYDRSFDVFKLTHATAEYLSCDPSSQERRDRVEVVRAATQDAALLKNLKPPPLLNEQRLQCHRGLRCFGAAERTPFPTLGTEFRAKSNRPSSLAATLVPTHLNRYACTDLLARVDGASESVQLSAVSTSSLQPGDVVCQFIGLYTSIVLRQHGDYYSFIGKAYLDDSFHTRFWQGSGSVRDIQRLTLQASPEIWQGSRWTDFLDRVSTKPLTQLVPDELGSVKLAIDLPTLLELCW